MDSKRLIGFERILVVVGILSYLVIFSANTSSAAVISSSFDADLDGWTIAGGGTLDWRETGGNPGGYIETKDTVTDRLYLVAADKFLGDLTTLDGGTLSFDAKLLFDNGETPVADFGLITLTGDLAGETYSKDLVPVPDVPMDWTKYSIDFTAAGWGVNESIWGNLINDITRITIVWESLGKSNEITGLDNFQIGSDNVVPEPASILLMIIGISCIAGAGLRKK